ncbi:MAG: hypothetical protein DMG57_04965 [Acidobacteria bacterium]|nr:MAG: hypothetical protein DMG57_04965 [Acidobacteriota bacterium]
MSKTAALTLFSLLAFPVAPRGDAQTSAPKSEPKYEMRNYVVGFLYRGPKWTAESTPETERIQEGHLANIRKMAALGKLAVAGPFSDHGDLRGMFIFQIESVDEARALANEDPAIQSGRLRLELHPWFAASGLKVDPPK